MVVSPSRSSVSSSPSPPPAVTFNPLEIVQAEYDHYTKRRDHDSTTPATPASVSLSTKIDKVLAYIEDGKEERELAAKQRRIEHAKAINYILQRGGSNQWNAVESMLSNKSQPIFFTGKIIDQPDTELVRDAVAHCLGVRLRPALRPATA